MDNCQITQTNLSRLAECPWIDPEGQTAFASTCTQTVQLGNLRALKVGTVWTLSGRESPVTSRNELPERLRNKPSDGHQVMQAEVTAMETQMAQMQKTIASLQQQLCVAQQRTEEAVLSATQVASKKVYI